MLDVKRIVELDADKARRIRDLDSLLSFRVTDRDCVGRHLDSVFEVGGPFGASESNIDADNRRANWRRRRPAHGERGSPRHVGERATPPRPKSSGMSEVSASITKTP